MAAIALVVTAILAIAGWMVSQYQARRATRRNMRINYLLDAYRRLDRASNRNLNPEYERELEAAISDVMLLGSPDQARLAADFATAFEAEHIAETKPLLLTLRNSLRRELLLEDLPSTSYVSLRVGFEGDTASATAQVWREAIDSTRRSVESEIAEIGTAPDGHREWQTRRTVLELPPNVSPSHVVEDNARKIEHLLRELLARRGAEDTSSLNMQRLASRALQSGLIDANLADSINSLSMMLLLATMDQDMLTPKRAAEFVNYSTVIALLIEQAGRRSHGQPVTTGGNNQESWPGSDPGMAR